MYKDVSTLANKRKDARKEDLAQWVSLAFKKAFMLQSFANILKQLT
jgi:hypothetical protein